MKRPIILAVPEIDFMLILTYCIPSTLNSYIPFFEIELIKEKELKSIPVRAM
jgi:hypothetical protein